MKLVARMDAATCSPALVPQLPATMKVPPSGPLRTGPGGSGTAPPSAVDAVAQLIRAESSGRLISDGRLVTLLCLVDLTALAAEGRTVTGTIWRPTSWLPEPAGSTGAATGLHLVDGRSGGRGRRGAGSRRETKRLRRMVAGVMAEWGDQSLPTLVAATRLALVTHPQV